MEVSIPKFGFHRSIQVIWQFDINNCVINTRRTWGRVLNWNMRRAWGRALNCNMFVHCVVVRVSHHTDTNCLFLRCLIGQLRAVVIHIDIFVQTIVIFYSFIVCNQRFGWGHRRCLRELWFRWRGFTSHLIIVVRNIS